MKFIHNDKVSLAWAIFVELAVHALFAFQAFLLGGFLGELALTAIFGAAGAKIGAWGLAIFVFGAAFQAFVLGEYMQEHVKSYEDTRGDGSYLRAWKKIRWLVGGIEVSSLAFRVIVVLLQQDYLQAGVVALFGILTLLYAYYEAKVIHASVNRDVDYDIERSQHHAGITLAQKSMRYTKHMTPEQLARWHDGDASALQEVATSGFFEEEQRKSAKAQKQQDKRTRELGQRRSDEAKQERVRGSKKVFYNPSSWKRTPVTFHHPKDDPDFLSAQSSQADSLSHNGHR